MRSLLIRDTTREERQQIVDECIDSVEGACDACSPGIAEMYQDYIDGKRELREINMDFRRGTVSAITGPDTPPGRPFC